ncbi:PAS domain-containing sensor histidine kinase [Leptolyngbya sp. GB1-A1]|uniref:PAS domain-containing sensor histidine kinase n=1 Tax=Leptolyngbya sp. GB1-A1 TaxID=2933908 RepID=UPI003296C1F6
MSHSGQNLDGDVEPSFESAADLLRIIAQRLDRLQSNLPQGNSSDPNHSLNPIEVGKQLQNDAAALRQIADRAQLSEHHLRQMQERFSKAFCASPVAMCISRLADGYFVEANDRFLELVEYSREELIGKTSIELSIFEPQERAFLLSLLLHTSEPVEWWFHSRSRKKRLARIASETIELNDELHLLVLVEDITDYRRVQADLQQLNEELESIVQQRTQELQASQTALQNSQRQLEAVLDNSPLLIYLLDLENRHLLVNRRYEELVGRSRQELIGFSAESVWGSARAGTGDYLAETVFEHLQQVRDSRQRIEVEEVLYIHQQQCVYLSNKFPLFDDQGNLYAVGGICLDITGRVRIEEERKQAQAAVAQREREYRTLVENSPDVIMRVNWEGQFLYVSPSFSRTFGVPQQDCIGKTKGEIGLSSNLSDLCYPQLEPVFDRQEPQTIEFPIHTSQGPRFYQSWAVPELDEQGNVISALIIGRDITQIKQAEQRLQQAIAELERVNRLKDEFLSTVSHELRTPVSNMKLSMRMLEVAMQRANFEPDARLLQYLSILNQECDREINLINDLLDLQKLEANKRELTLEPIDLENWLPRLIEPFQERAQNRQQQLRLELPKSSLPKLTSDPSSLDRILAELLNNACKYTPPGGQIVLQAALDSQKILLTVCNSGIKIPIDELPRIFDKFYRVPSTDPWKQGGTGLGLALVQKLVKHLQGAIQVESSAAQTVFTVTLPLNLPIDILPVSQND